LNKSESTKSNQSPVRGFETNLALPSKNVKSERSVNVKSLLSDAGAVPGVQMQHYVKTAYGISDTSYGCIEIPLLKESYKATALDQQFGY
jgi:hypothetical protein